MLASEATMSTHASATATGGADAQVIVIGYANSRRDNSSTLIWEISSSASRNRCETSTREPTTCANAEGTYIKRPATCRYT